MTEPVPKQPLRICHSCRSITAADKAQCANCGAVSADIATTQHENMREQEFAQTFFSRESTFTWIFFGINIGIYVLTCFASGPEPHVLIAMGAKLNRLVNQGQVWRLVTPIFIHGGLLHLVVNSYALYALGPTVERLYGSARFVALYLGAGIVSVATSYLLPWLGTDLPSVGASGALFGLIGVLTVFGYKYRDELPGQFKKAFGARLIPIILLNLAIGLIIPIIDNSAHLGGLMAGGLLAMVVPYKRAGSRDLTHMWRILQILLLALIPLCFFKARSNYDGPPLSIKRFDLGLAPGRRTELSTVALNEASKAFSRAFNKRDPVLTLSAMQPLNEAPDVFSELDTLRDQMKGILPRLHDVLKEAKDKGQEPDENALAALRCEHDRWIDGYKAASIRMGPGWVDDPDEIINIGPGCNR